MPLTSSDSHYGRIAVLLHWSIALLIVIALVSGFATNTIGEAAHGPLRTHMMAGIAAGLLTLARIAWWLIADRRPRHHESGSRVQDTTARWVHILLYAVPLGMVASGIGMAALSGVVDQLASGAALPRFEDFAPRAPHGLGARLLLALFVIHVGAALYHHFVVKDDLMARLRWKA